MTQLFFVSALFLFVGLFKSSYAVAPQLQQAIDLTYNAQFAEAESTANAYIAGHPADPVGYMVRGTSLDWKQKVLNLRKSLDGRVLEDYKKANDMAFHQWEKDPDNLEKMVNLGNSYMYLSKKWLDQGKKSRAGLILKKCQKHMNEAISKEPRYYEAYLANGLFNFYAANIPPGLSIIASILGISGNESLGLQQMQIAANNPNALQADALFVLTYAYGQTKKNYSMAQKYLDQLIVTYPKNPFFLHLKGEYAYRANLYDQSRADFDAFFAFCNAHAGACAKVYEFLAHYFIAAGLIKQGNLTAAAPHVAKAWELNENQFEDRTVNLHLYRGLVLKAAGKKGEALAEFKKVESLQEKNPKAWQTAKEAMKGL